MTHYRITTLAPQDGRPALVVDIGTYEASTREAALAAILSETGRPVDAVYRAHVAMSPSEARDLEDWCQENILCYGRGP